MANEALGAARAAAAGAAPQAEVLDLFAGYGTALYRFCRFTLGRDDEAEDVVQDTFLKLLVHLGRGGDRTNLRAWLFAVAANGCRDRIRARIRWRPWRAGTDDPVVVPDDESPDRRAIAAAMTALAPRDRLLLSLRAQGLSYRDIASASGIRPQSVGTLLARAAARWRQAYRGTP